MDAILNCKRDADAQFSKGRSSKERALSIVDQKYGGSEVIIYADAEDFAYWAKMILREVEPAALAPETESA